MKSRGLSTESLSISGRFCAPRSQFSARELLTKFLIETSLRQSVTWASYQSLVIPYQNALWSKKSKERKVLLQPLVIVRHVWVFLSAIFIRKTYPGISKVAGRKTFTLLSELSFNRAIYLSIAKWFTASMLRLHYRRCTYTDRRLKNVKWIRKTVCLCG
jgi:hypothetical protein